MKSLVDYINENLKEGRQNITFFEFLTNFAEEIGENFKIDSEKSMEEFLEFIANDDKYGFYLDYEESVYMYGQYGSNNDSTDDKDFKRGNKKVIELINKFFLKAKSAEITITTDKNGTKAYWFTYRNNEFALYIYK